MIKGRVKKGGFIQLLFHIIFFETFPKGFFKIAKKKFEILFIGKVKSQKKHEKLFSSV